MISNKLLKKMKSVVEYNCFSIRSNDFYVIVI